MHWETIVWWSRKQIIAVSSVSPNAQCLIANYRCPKQPSLNQLYTLPATFPLACPRVFSFTRKRKSPLSPRSGQIQISLRNIARNKSYNCTMEQFSLERCYHGFSTGLKVTLTNNLCIIWPRFRGEAVTKFYEGPSRRLFTDP